jgi:predicted ATPase
LFPERARAARATFEVTESERGGGGDLPAVDGIPLAIELAAARAAYLRRSRSPLAWTTASACSRPGRQSSMPTHRTLRALVD